MESIIMGLYRVQDHTRMPDTSFAVRSSRFRVEGLGSRVKVLGNGT